MNIQEILKQAVEQDASDIFMIPGIPISMTVSGQIRPMNSERIFPDAMDKLITEIYEISNHRKLEHILDTGDDDFSFALPGLSRFRASIMKQRGSLGAIIRIVRFELPDYTLLGIPDGVMKISTLKKGLVLVTGAAGSGKSTTLACVIDKINHERGAHIITLEDPIEYLHQHKMAMVNQS